MRPAGLLALAATCLLAVAAPPPALATTLPPGFSEETIVSGLSKPTAVDWAPDGRMFVAEKDGRVRVVSPSGFLRPAPLIDLTGRVNAVLDRGLLGLAVDSDFETNRYLWVLYVHESDSARAKTDAAWRDGPKTSRLSRFTVNPDNSVSAEMVVLGKDSTAPCPPASNTADCIPADTKMHAVGTVRSDPDGTLWVSNGDARDNTTIDPAYRPYDERSYAGKILHVDRNGRGLPGHPFCADDNDLTHVCTKVYAKGFRNPFRFTLRPGRGPAVGDVGRYTREELDLVQPGKNYGWPCYEGTVRTSLFQAQARCKEEYAKTGADAAVAPAWDYEHLKLPDGTRIGGSITGGPTYLGSSYPPEYRGSLLVGDYTQGWVKRLTLDGDRVTGVHPFATGWPAGVDMKLAPNGDLAYVDINFTGSGSVKRISYSESTDPAPTARASASPTSGTAPLAVQFTGSASSDPDGDALSYDWNFGDGSAHSSQANPSHSYPLNGSYTARLTVNDGKGHSDSATVAITVGAAGNKAPVPRIDAPSDESFFTPGSLVSFRGSGSDPEDGTLGPSRLSWQVLQHHNEHLHEAHTHTGAGSSFTTDNDHGPDPWYYEIRLTVRDSDGRESTTSVDVRPNRSPDDGKADPPPPPPGAGGGGGTAGGAPPAPNPPEPPVTQPPPTTPAAPAAPRLTSARLSFDRRRGALMLRAGCSSGSAGQSCRLTSAGFEALIQARGRTRARVPIAKMVKPVLLGSGRARTVRVPLSRRSRLILQRRGRVLIRATLVLRGANGTSTRVRRTLRVTAA